jgi:hypothetical protein
MACIFVNLEQAMSFEIFLLFFKIYFQSIFNINSKRFSKKDKYVANTGLKSINFCQNIKVWTKNSYKKPNSTIVSDLLRKFDTCPV